MKQNDIAWTTWVNYSITHVWQSSSITIGWCRVSYNRERSAEFGSAMVWFWQARHTNGYEIELQFPQHYQCWAVPWNISVRCRFHSNWLAITAGFLCRACVNCLSLEFFVSVEQLGLRVWSMKADIIILKQITKTIK